MQLSTGETQVYRCPWRFVSRRHGLPRSNGVVVPPPFRRDAYVGKGQYHRTTVLAGVTNTRAFQRRPESPVSAAPCFLRRYSSSAVASLRVTGEAATISLMTPFRHCSLSGCAPM